MHLINLSCLLLLLLCTQSKLSAQIFWSEDFAGGIPLDWSTGDLSGQNLLWNWCSKPTTDPNSTSCPRIWNDGTNNQETFQSTTAENGFALFNSYGKRMQTSTEHISYLQSSAIDCSGKTNVFLEFESHIGLFVYPALSNAILLVSNDGTNWTTFECFPNLVPEGNVDLGFLRWSYNPEKSYFDISSIAANQSTVYLKWQWTGFIEYHWSLDDIKIGTQDFKPKVDLSLKPKGTFQAMPPNYKIPVDQLELMHFLTDFGNNGTASVSDIKVTARVRNAATNIIEYEEEILVESLEPNEIIENQKFPVFFPELNKGIYTLNYSIESSQLEEYPIDNSKEFIFQVTDSIFQKENGDSNISLLTFSPQDFEPNRPLNWSIGNYYYLPNGSGKSLSHIELGLAESRSPQGSNVNFNDENYPFEINLYSWLDVNQDQNAQLSECVKIAESTQLITKDNQGKISSFKLKNALDGTEDIPLQDNTHYLVMVEYKTTLLNRGFALLGSSSIDYNAMIFATDINSTSRFASFASIGNSDVFSSPGISSAAIPIIRMHTSSKTVSTRDVLDGQKYFSLQPNPADNYIQIIQKNHPKIEFDSYDLYNSKGQLQRSERVEQGELKIMTSDLENGFYILHLRQAEKNYRSTFIVQH